MMFVHKWTATVLCLTFVGLLISSHSALSATVMPLGDSGTLGAFEANDFGIGGYRTPLWSRLTGEGYSVDFVGSVNGPTTADADPNHEGHGGWRIDDLAGGIDSWLATYRPDIILLMAGGNDIIQGYGVNTAMSRMDTLLAKIFADRPNAVVLLGSLWWVPTPNFYNYDVNQIRDMNSRLPSLVSKYSGQGRAIELVDQYNLGWGTGNFGSDQIHPNTSGYAKMAQAWHDPLARRLTAVPAGNFCPGGVDCHGNPVTTGTNVCGTDFNAYDCTASGWQRTGQACTCGGSPPPADNFCPGGVDCHGNPVTTGSNICGTDYNAYNCTASGWQRTGQTCSCGATQNFCPGGVDCHGNPVTTGNNVCGTDFKTYNCTASGWQGTGQPCSCGAPTENFCPGGIDCHGQPMTSGTNRCGVELKLWNCTASGWQGPGQNCVCGAP